MSNTSTAILGRFPRSGINPPADWLNLAQIRGFWPKSVAKLSAIPKLPRPSVAVPRFERRGISMGWAERAFLAGAALCAVFLALLLIGQLLGWLEPGTN